MVKKKPLKPPGGVWISKKCQVSFCFLHAKVGPAVWAKAYKRAQELDYRKGKPKGLYPMKWEASQDDIIIYHYDLLDLTETRVGFCAYSPEIGTMHIGIYDTITEQSVATQKDVFTLHKIFRAELLGLAMPFPVEQKS